MITLLFVGVLVLLITGAIVTFEGVMGSGKTTAAVAFASEEKRINGRKVIANIHLNFEFQLFSLEWFLENLASHEMEDCVLLLDEMYQIADSRSSGTKLNKLFSYFIVQARKRRVDVYFCTHVLGNVDLRLRQSADIRNSCRCFERICPKCRCHDCGGTGKVPGGNGERGRLYDCPTCQGRGGTGYDNKTGKACEACLGFGKQGWIRLHVLDRRAKKRYTPDDFFANPYWLLFNSYDRIPLPAKALAGIDTTEVG
jgi:hypothetical protein